MTEVSQHLLQLPVRKALCTAALKTRSDLGLHLNNLGLLGEGVELGTYEGEFAEQILRNWRGEKLWLVDSWCYLDDYLDSYNGSDEVMQARYELAMRRLQCFRSRVGWLRERTEIGVSRFQDETLDFIYVDANHSYFHALNDLRLWYPKVKRGGLISGHDYFDALADDSFEPSSFGSWPKELLTSYGVKSAVTEFAKDLGVEVSVIIEDLPTWFFRKP